jgi:peptidoglycan hydrolase-like protein with peptidoglycan-binding domain
MKVTIVTPEVITIKQRLNNDNYDGRDRHYR